MVAPRAYHHEILHDFPYLEREDIAEALQYAAEAVRERQLPLVADGWFLVDASLSFRVAEALQKADHDAVHVRDVMSVDAPDTAIFDHAAGDDRIVVSADTDFGELLTVGGPHGCRWCCCVGARDGGRRDQSTLLLTQLPAVSDDLEAVRSL